MKLYVLGLLACLPILSAATIKGVVSDPSGAPIAGAQISVVDRTGVQNQTTAGPSGAFDFNLPAAPSSAKLVITAPGFRTADIPLSDAPESIAVKLELP